MNLKTVSIQNNVHRTYVAIVKQEFRNVVEDLSLPLNVFIAQLVFFFVLFAFELVIIYWIVWEETVVNLEVLDIGATSSSVLLSSSKINKFASSKNHWARGQIRWKTYFNCLAMHSKLWTWKCKFRNILLSSFLLRSNRTTLTHPIQLANRINFVPALFGPSNMNAYTIFIPLFTNMKNSLTIQINIT